MLFRRFWQVIVYLLSFEWFLTPTRPNGGDVVLARSICVALVLCGAALALRNLLDPNLGNSLSATAFRTQLLDFAPWFAGAVGAVYAALYARFASQWDYLAQLYNQIKQAELELLCSDTKNEAQARKKLNEWKAGYIEDAQNLHLHAKENVAAIVHFWGKDQAVVEAFVATSPGGTARWTRVHGEATAAHEAASIRHARRVK